MLSTGIAGVAEAIMSAGLTVVSLPLILVVGVMMIGLVVHIINKLMSGGNSGIFPPQNYQPWSEQPPQIVYLPQPQPMAALPEMRAVRSLPAVITLKGESR